MLKNQDRKLTSIACESVTSTQNEALSLFNKTGCGNYIVTAKSMTQGRGRHGNAWLSREGNLNFTMFLSSNLSLINRFYLPFTLSLALHELISGLVTKNVEVAIKWPNDIYIEGRKVAGVLIETGMKASSQKLLYLNIGIGINIANHPEITGIETTSLNNYCDNLIKAEDMIEPLRQKILFWLDKANEYEWEELKQFWLKKAYNFGKEISTTYHNSKITGIFKDLSNRGELIMSLSHGEDVYINTGVIEEV